MHMCMYIHIDKGIYIQTLRQLNIPNFKDDEISAFSNITDKHFNSYIYIYIHFITWVTNTLMHTHIYNTYMHVYTHRYMHIDTNIETNKYT
jgi:hypothetical protein